MTIENIKVIGGIEFTAVRFAKPIPHWRLQLPSGEILEAGASSLDSRSRPKLFESVEYLMQRLGEERFRAGFGL